MTSDRLRRLADAVRDRRADLGLAQGQLAERGGPSIVTVGQIERGQIERPQASTLRRLDDALGWERGSASRVLAGGEPTVTPPNPGPEAEVDRGPVGGADDAASYVAHPGERTAGGLTDDEVLALIRESRRLADELERRIAGETP